MSKKLALDCVFGDNYCLQEIGSDDLEDFSCYFP